MNSRSYTSKSKHLELRGEDTLGLGGSFLSYRIVVAFATALLVRDSRIICTKSSLGLTSRKNKTEPVRVNDVRERPRLGRSPTRTDQSGRGAAKYRGRHVSVRNQM